MRTMPSAQYADNIQTQTQTAFGGYDHRVGAGEGTIYDSWNLSSDRAPLLAPCRAARRICEINETLALCRVGDKLYAASGFSLYRLDTEEEQEVLTRLAELDDIRYKTLCAMGSRLLIFPDKLCYDTESGELTALEASVTRSGLTFGSGVYGGVAAAANAITGAAGDFSDFRAGDVVQISDTTNPANAKFAQIDSIDQDGARLNFSEHCFTLTGDSETDHAAVTIARRVPDLTHLCVNENRVWGCKDDTIYCSRLGDPTNWYNYSGLSTDAWSVSGLTGAFTACCSFLGYPVFFKEDRVFKVFGSTPERFQLLPGPTQGVAMGAADTLAVAGETLIYLSPSGPVSYSGGTTYSLAAAFGEDFARQWRLDSACAGSDGRRYYLALRRKESLAPSVFVYDTEAGTWQCQEGNYVSFARVGARLFAAGPVNLYAIGEGAYPDTAWAEFAPTFFTSPYHKQVAKLILRYELSAGATLSVDLRYDDAPGWDRVATITAQEKTSAYLPIIPRRCDRFTLYVAGSGDWLVRSIAYEYAPGTAL